MSFLAPILLFGLPLALLPVVIHLIHMRRRRRVMWAATMFLKAAQRMNKGFSKLRQYLILAFRMLAVAAIIFVIGRPLAGGLLGLTGGAPASVIVLLDRSASMEQQLLATGVSKRAAALRNLTAAINEAYGDRSKLTLIDSATLQPVVLESADALPDLPQAGPTETSADIPAMMQAALDYITNNQTGRTDVWLVSDLRRSDWNAGGGRWQALRAGFSTLDNVRFQVLAYPEDPSAGMGVTVENVIRRETNGKAELLLDARLYRSGADAGAADVTVPVRVTVNGVVSTLEAQIKGREALLQAQSIPIDIKTKRGWGRVELPADSSPSDNVFHFVFDDPPALKSTVVSDSPEVSTPLLAALKAQADPSRSYACQVLPAGRAAEIVWDETALIVWQAPIPQADSVIAKQLTAHVRAGRRLIFVPPKDPEGAAFDGLRWATWQSSRSDDPVLVDWWRDDSGLVSGTRAGKALPVGEIRVRRWCGLEGENIPLARLGEAAESAVLLAQATDDSGRAPYFLATLPGSGSSSLARDGIVLFALLHRALNEGGNSLGNALQRDAGRDALGESDATWQRLGAGPGDEPVLTFDLPLRAGVLQRESADPDQPGVLVALNRPPGEDAPQTLATPALDELFDGLDWRLLERSLENEKSLASEVWRLFLLLMGAAIIFEALLCLPSKPDKDEVDWKGEAA
ncbi:MAG: BatA domain-containing protein [Verrucomicrobiales bacterium]